MLQPFAFKGDFDQVYRIARRFLYSLSLSGITVSLPDGYRSVTKNYDYGSVTVIEVFPDIVVAEQVEQIEFLYADAILRETPVPEQAKQSESEETKPASNDFDPFLDGGDLP